MDHWLKNAIENLFSHSIEINDFLLAKREWLYTGVDERDDCDTCYQALDQMGFTTTGLIDLIDAVRNGWFTEPKLMTSQKRNKYNL